MAKTRSCASESLALRVRCTADRALEKALNDGATKVQQVRGALTCLHTLSAWCSLQQAVATETTVLKSLLYIVLETPYSCFL